MTRLFKTLCIIGVFIASFTTAKAQLPPNIVPYEGIPVLVPATLNELNVANGYCQLTYGIDGLQRDTTNCNLLNLIGHINGFQSPSSHLILNSGTFDPRACIDNVSGVYLNTFPTFSDWDTAHFGIPRVMRMGDENAGSYPSASSSSTYYFTPTEDENVLITWFSFVSQSVPWHRKDENALFKIEVTDINGNYVTGDYQNSTFYIIPESYTDPYVSPCCQDILYRFLCSGSNPDPTQRIDVFWASWVRLAFDLRPYIGQTVRLRIIVSECIYHAHYTYCYFTGYGIKGSIDVLSCNGDNIYMTSPKGFQNYKWYVNNTHIPEADGLYYLQRIRNTSETSFKCTMTSETGAPFEFNAAINYYNLFPSFTWEQKFDECTNKVQFTNTSEIYKINNGGNVYQPVQYVLWDFGDGQTSTEISPLHYYDGTGPYNVTLTIWDADSVCNAGSNDSQPIEINLIPSIPMLATDTVSTCEEKLPYIYTDPLMDPNDVYSWTVPGNYEVTYPNEAWNGCDSIVTVTLEIDKPSVRIEQYQDYCETFSAELQALADPENVTYLWSNDETNQSIIITEHGTYSVTVTDENGCNASSFKKILACEPPIYIPTAITPSDKNGLNDCVELYAANLIDHIELTIFDRFGQVVYKTYNKNFKWCGDVYGQLPLNVVYQYILIIVDNRGIETMKRGTITVL
jgi:hypothetical protein